MVNASLSFSLLYISCRLRVLAIDDPRTIPQSHFLHMVSELEGSRLIFGYDLLFAGFVKLRREKSELLAVLGEATAEAKLKT